MITDCYLGVRGIISNTQYISSVPTVIRMDREKIKQRILRDLRLGLYKLIVLSIIHKYGPIHGYNIRKKIEELSDGLLRPSESTIYDTLKKLEKLGLIESYWVASSGYPMKKYYRIKTKDEELVEEIISEALKEGEIINRILRGDTP